MNGRVYDYRLGRFLSVDPIISNPANSQSINPYSYIGNNPLSGTDPTGYCEDTLTGSHICGVVPAGPLTINGYTIPGYVVSMFRRAMDNGGSNSGPNVSLAPANTGNPNQTASQDANQSATKDKDNPVFRFMPGSADAFGPVEDHSNQWFVDPENGALKQTGDWARWRDLNGKAGALGYTNFDIADFMSWFSPRAGIAVMGAVGRFTLKKGMLQLEKTAAKRAITLVRDLTGKVHGKLPKIEHLKDASPAQIKGNIEELRASILVRKQELERLGEHAGHRARIGEEESLLRSL